MLRSILIYTFVMSFIVWIFNGFSFAETAEDLNAPTKMIQSFFFLGVAAGLTSVVDKKLKELEKRLPPEEPAEQDAPEEEQDAAKEE